MYLYMPFFFSFGGCVFFLPHSMSLSLGAEVNVTFTPALVNAILSCGAISGM